MKTEFVNCIVCNIVFEKHCSIPKKYCSRQCYALKRSTRSLEFKKNQSETIKKYYQNATKEERQKRNNSIKKARTVNYTEEELEKLYYILDLKYIKDVHVILKLCDLHIEGKGVRVFWRQLKENPILALKFESVYTGLPLAFQKWPLEKYLQFKKDSYKLDHVTMEQKYNLGAKSFYNICKKLNIKWGKIEETGKWRETIPEKIVNELLLNLNINFERERYLGGSTLRVDFKINRKIIEVQGDYYHANPLIYNYEKLTAMQYSNVVRDMKKKEWLLNNNYELLEIWEQDLYKNLETVRQNIKNYVSK